jgi:hypothetical protein
MSCYQWPSTTSPILPPISSRTPHLIPETMMPSTTIHNSSNSTSQQQQQQQFSSNYHYKSSGSWSEISHELSIFSTLIASTTKTKFDDQFCSTTLMTVAESTETTATTGNISISSSANGTNTGGSKFTRQRERVSRSLDKY